MDNYNTIYFGYRTLYEAADEITPEVVEFLNSAKGIAILAELAGEDVTAEIGNQEEEQNMDSSIQAPIELTQGYDILVSPLSQGGATRL